MRRRVTGVVAAALGILVLQGCASPAITDGVPGRAIDGLHEGGPHPAAPTGAPRGGGSRWPFGIGDPGLPDGGGPETDPGEPHARGALVSSVVEGSPAMKAGLRAGDVITAYDDRPVVRSEHLSRAVADSPVGREVPVTLVRQGKTLTLTVKIGRLEVPTQEATAARGARSGLGLSLQALTPALARELGLRESRGVVISEVEEDSPAADAGLQAGDVIVEIDRHPVQAVSQVEPLVAEHRSGTPLLLLIHRERESLYVAVGGLTARRRRYGARRDHRLP